MNWNALILALAGALLAAGSLSATPPAGVELVPVKTALVCLQWELREVK
jgi:hypothetical protein